MMRDENVWTSNLQVISIENLITVFLPNVTVSEPKPIMYVIDADLHLTHPFMCVTFTFLTCRSKLSTPALV